MFQRDPFDFEIPFTLNLTSDITTVTSFVSELENDPNFREVLNGVTGVRLSAQLIDGVGSHANAEMHFLAHYSANKQHIRVSTSTTDPRVSYIL